MGGESYQLKMYIQEGKKMKRTIKFLLISVLILSMLTGCSSSKGEFDGTGYIKSVLNCSYSASYDEYVTFTGSTTDAAEDYHSATLQNAAVRFFSKYEMNADDSQVEKMEAVLEKAYANSKFTVNSQTEASYGYDVVVSYTVQTTLQNISSDIQEKRDLAATEGLATNIGADYITEIIELCENTVENSTSYGDSMTVTFDIKKDSDGYLSLNTTLFDEIDENILPF
jgi:hypothetical protein